MPVVQYRDGWLHWDAPPFCSVNFHLVLGEIEERRQKILDAANRSDETIPDLYSGRLLLFVPNDSLSDGAATLASSGFFDRDNLPPWDTWAFTASIESNEVPRWAWSKAETKAVFVAWAPPEFLTVADHGIEANPEQCIAWAPNELLTAVIATDWK